MQRVTENVVCAKPQFNVETPKFEVRTATVRTPDSFKDILFLVGIDKTKMFKAVVVLLPNY